jgi:hypothetical protein
MNKLKAGLKYWKNHASPILAIISTIGMIYFIILSDNIRTDVSNYTELAFYNKLQTLWIFFLLCWICSISQLIADIREFHKLCKENKQIDESKQVKEEKITIG